MIASDGAGVRKVQQVGAHAGIAPDFTTLQPGTIVRINTGAPVPAGADAVVQVEDTKLVKSSEDGKEEIEVEILKAPVKGQDIRPVGSDIESGSVVLKRQTPLNAAERGILATVGATKVKVFQLPKVSLLSTGNELQDPEAEDLKPGAIRDSNKTTLKTLLRSHGFPFVDCGIAIDEPTILKV